ncbi:MAG: lycopene cyclase domain-containing protein [Saprospiraceae bacterium]
MKMNDRTSQKISWILGSFSLIMLVLAIIQPVHFQSLEREVPGVSEVTFFETKMLYWVHHALAGIPVLLLITLYPFFPGRFYFFKKWWKPILAGSVFFILWDFVFSKLGIWGFNERYISGQTIFGFPIEEICWFPIIAMCSLFVHELVSRFSIDESRWAYGTLVVVFLGMLIFYGFNFDKMYSGVSAAIVNLILFWFWRGGILAEIGRFSRSFLVILIPMILFDGLLTGMFTKQALVIYNFEEFSGQRIGSIPIEDFIFGYGFLSFLILLQNRFATISKSTF